MFLPVVFDRLKYGSPVSIYDDGPRIVIWEMTRACGLCRHRRTKATPQRDARELTSGDAFDLVDEAAAYGRPIFILTGGGPFLQLDVFEIVASAAQRELRVGFKRTLTAAGHGREGVSA
jgi:AdoMet-dependent heme synthase